MTRLSMLVCKTKSQSSRSGSRRRRGLQPWGLEGLEARQLLSATVYMVTDTTDNVSDPNSLAGALSAANANTNPEGSLIEFNLGSSGATISLTNPLYVDPTEPLTIEGPGAGELTITGNNLVGVFDCSSGDTTISGLTITEGVGVPDVEGNVYGGGVKNEAQSTLQLDQCNITDCSQAMDGGGIANFGTLTIEGGWIYNDSAGAGGGVYNADSGSATIEGGCTITGNSAGDGGGLCNESTTPFDLYGCTISSNMATDSGGGLDNDGTAIVGGPNNIGVSGPLGCTIIDNDATNNGGGIYNSNTGTVEVSNGSMVGGNIAQDGAGLYNTGTATLDTGCTINGNDTSKNGNGGGIYNTAMVAVNVFSTISDNNATDNGGGLYNTGTATVSGTTMSGNSAQNGGGIYNTGTATVSAVTVSNNSAGQSGGGIFNTGTGMATIESLCTISGNTAGSDGGGLVNEGQASLSASTISGNLATTGGTNNGEGAGLFVASSQSTTLVECTISGNSAQAGSGLYVMPNNPGQVALTSCTMADNSAITTAALFAPLAPVSLTDTIVAGNTASGGGASDILGTVTGSYNLIGTGGSGTLANGSNGNIVLTSLTGLGLAPLANYNGWATFYGNVLTMALLPGSPALGTGTPISGITTDERGASIGSSVDIGAFQSQGFTIAIVPGDSPQAVTAGYAFTNPLAVTVKATDTWEPVAGGVVTFAATPGATGASAALSAATAVIGANGVASVTATANSTLGAYTVSASAAGAAAPVDFDLTNSLGLPATVNLSVSPASPMYGQPVTLLATVTGAGSPTGMVTFFEGGTTLQTVPLNASGQAMWTVSNLPVGADSITAAYGGDRNFASQTSAPASVTVTPDVTGMVMMLQRVIKKKKKVAIDLLAEIEPTYPGAVAPTGTVRFMVKKRTLGTATVTDGKATLTVKPTVQLKTLTVVYSGDVDYSPCTTGPAVKTPKATRARHADR